MAVQDITPQWFEARVAKCPMSGCWLWLGTIYGGRYGIATLGNKTRILAHRLSYTTHRGLIPDGMFVCHTCDVMSCVNPSHLFLGTPKDNLVDCAKKNRTAHGERSPKSKFTAAQIESIFHDTRRRKDVAKEYGVNITTIARIQTKLTWSRETPTEIVVRKRGRRLGSHLEKPAKKRRVTHIG